MKRKASYSKEESEGETFLKRNRVYKDEETTHRGQLCARNSHGLDYEDFLFEDVTSLKYGRNLATFRRNALLPSSFLIRKWIQ
jgi:hypothetical protein